MGGLRSAARGLALAAAIAAAQVATPAPAGAQGAGSEAGAASRAGIEVVTDAEKEGGHLVELTEAAFRAGGLPRPHIRYMPWARALHLAMEGQADMLLGPYHNEERARRLAYSEPIGDVRVHLFALKSRGLAWSSLEDLRPFRIATINQSTVTPQFDAAAASYLRIEPVTDTDQMVRLLLSGRADLAVEKRQGMLKVLGQRFPAEAALIVALEPPLRVDHFYNAFPKSRPDHAILLEAFNRGLREVRANGLERAILQRHGLRPGE